MGRKKSEHYETVVHDNAEESQIISIIDENQVSNEDGIILHDIEKFVPWKEKKCNIIGYNRKNKTLDIYFDYYGIRIENVEGDFDDAVILKYRGTIGKPNFEYTIT